MSRRIGQKGSVFQHSQKWAPAGKTYGRFWVDVPGCRRQRRTIALGVCRTPSVAKQKLREYIETTGVNNKQTFTSTTAPATTLRLQAEKWIASLSTRRRKPVKPATISGWQHSLDKWVLPNLGDLLLADVGNAALKGLIDKMSCAGLSPQTIVTHSKVVKMVVASAVNAEGGRNSPAQMESQLRRYANCGPDEATSSGCNPSEASRDPCRHQTAVRGPCGFARRHRPSDWRGFGLEDGRPNPGVQDVTCSAKHLAWSRASSEDRECCSCDRRPGTTRTSHTRVRRWEEGLLIFHAKRHSSVIEECASRLIRRQCDVRVPFIQTVSGGCAAQSPGTRRPDWIVARARSKPYRQVCHTVERRRCIPIRVVRACGLGLSVGLHWATKCCAD